MIKVSVIIPVYNVQKYLVKCIDSVINQTLKDIEIICVDDGSTDNCPAILDQYAESDSRIKVIHKLNEGYGKAMNTGFDAAQGEYIGIVESDDFILPEMYEILYNCAEENKIDVVKSDYNLYWTMNDTVVNTHKNNTEKYYNKILSGSEKRYIMQFFSSNWSGIYKKEFLLKNNIRHHETPGASYQDIGFWFQVMAMTEKVMIIDNAFYMYRQDNLSSSVKCKDRLKMLCMINECEWVRKIFKDKNIAPEWHRYSIYHQLTDHIESFKRVDDSFKCEFLQIIKNDFDKYKGDAEAPVAGFKMYAYEWLEEAVRDLEGFYQKFITEKNNTIETVSAADKLIVYGTGQKAGKTFSGLYNKGYADKIVCAVVSENPISRTFFGKSVKRIDEIEDKNTLIIISVKKGTTAYNEIENNLRSLGFTNVIDSEIICDYF